MTAKLALPLYRCSECRVLVAPPDGEVLSGKCVIRRGAWEGEQLRICGGEMRRIGTLTVTPTGYTEEMR